MHTCQVSTYQHFNNVGLSCHSQGLNGLALDPVRSPGEEEFVNQPYKGLPRKYGLHLLLEFLDFPEGWESLWPLGLLPHLLICMVFLSGTLGCNSGGLGYTLCGVAVALWAKSKGGCTVSATVSMNKVGVGGVVVAGSSQSTWITGSSTGEVGGCARKSCTRSQTSLMVWGGELACSLLILSTALPTSRDSVPMKVGVRVVESTSSLGSWSWAW